MTSTGRFVALWMLVTVPTLALLSPVHLIYSGNLGIIVGTGCFEAVFLNELVFNVLAASAVAFGQEWLLTWHRQPARRWWALMTGGALASWMANYGLLSQLFKLVRLPGWADAWLIGASASMCAGVAFGVAAGFAVWGRSWPPVWRPWIAGVIAIYAAQAVLHGLLFTIVGDPKFTSSPLTWSILLKGADATVVAAGTVLWLDRLILKPATSTETGP